MKAWIAKLLGWLITEGAEKLTEEVAKKAKPKKKAQRGS